MPNESITHLRFEHERICKGCKYYRKNNYNLMCCYNRNGISQFEWMYKAPPHYFISYTNEYIVLECDTWSSEYYSIYDLLGCEPNKIVRKKTN